jgi:hypothetical protein
MSRTVAVFLSLLFTLSALPQTLTQERHVVPPGPLTRAANFQGQADAASNGHGFLVTWIDGRAGHGGYQNIGSLLWASHFGADGTLTSPMGLKLADGVFDARIASDGNDYLIAMRRSDGIYTQPFDDEGRALADALRVDTATTSPMLLASNGSGYLLATNNQSAIQWRMLDSHGHPAGDPHVISDSYSWNNNAAIVTNDGAYHLIYGTQNCSGQSCSPGVADVVVRNGQAAPSRTLVPPTNSVGYVSAASSGDQFLVAWGTPGGIDEQVFDSSDNAVTTPRPLTPGQAPMTVSWDGARYLVSRWDSADALIGQRIGRDGEPIDATPFAFANNAASQAAFSRGGGRALVVWSAVHGTPPTAPSDVYGRVVFDFNELAATTADPVRLSNAPSVQHTPTAAFSGTKAIRVWRGGDGNGSIEMAVDGGDTVVLSAEDSENQHDPDVAAIGDVALVVWRSDTRALRRVLGVRVDSNGKRLDEQPIVIDQGTLFAQPQLDRVSVATDGQSFLVAWSGQYVVNAKRMAKDGSLLDAAPIIASHDGFFIAAGVKVVWTGETYVVVFAFEDNHLTLRPPVATVELFAARITSAGVALDASENRSVYFENAVLLGGPSVAAAGDRNVIAFAEMPSGLSISAELHTVEVSVDPLPAPVASHVLARIDYPFNYPISDARIAARGDTFLVTWSQNGTNGAEVRGQLLDRGESFVVAGDDAYDVTVTPDANGFSFTYARTDPEAGYVARLFTRGLVLVPERHRAAAIR